MSEFDDLLNDEPVDDSDTFIEIEPCAECLTLGANIQPCDECGNPVCGSCRAVTGKPEWICCRCDGQDPPLVMGDGLLESTEFDDLLSDEPVSDIDIFYDANGVNTVICSVCGDEFSISYTTTCTGCGDRVCGNDLCYCERCRSLGGVCIKCADHKVGRCKRCRIRRDVVELVDWLCPECRGIAESEEFDDLLGDEPVGDDSDVFLMPRICSEEGLTYCERCGEYCGLPGDRIMDAEAAPPEDAGVFANMNGRECPNCGRIICPDCFVGRELCPDCLARSGLRESTEFDDLLDDDLVDDRDEFYGNCSLCHYLDRLNRPATWECDRCDLLLCDGHLQHKCVCGLIYCAVCHSDMDWMVCYGCGQEYCRHCAENRGGRCGCGAKIGNQHG